MQMVFKGILLDLDDTLYDYASANDKALEKTIDFLEKELVLPKSKIILAYKTARNQIHQQLAGHAASHSRLLYFQRLCENLNIKPWSIPGKAEDIFWDVFLDNMQLRSGVVNFLEQYSDIPIAIVSDHTNKIQLRKIEKLNLSQYIKALITSEEAGCEKPAPKIFRLALQKLGMTSDKTCMIGDSYNRDIQGALKLGMLSFWYIGGSTNTDTTVVMSKAKTKSAKVIRFSCFEDLSMLMSVHA